MEETTFHHASLSLLSSRSRLTLCSSLPAYFPLHPRRDSRGTQAPYYTALSTVARSSGNINCKHGCLHIHPHCRICIRGRRPRCQPWVSPFELCFRTRVQLKLTFMQIPDFHIHSFVPPLVPVSASHLSLRMCHSDAKC